MTVAELKKKLAALNDNDEVWVSDKKVWSCLPEKPEVKVTGFSAPESAQEAKPS